MKDTPERAANSRPFIHVSLAFFALLLSQIAIPVKAQTITAVPKFVPAQVLHLDLVQGRKDQRMDHSARTPVTVTVEEPNEEGAVIRWASGETELGNLPPQVATIVTATTEAMKDLTLVIQLSSTGEFKGVLNEAEVTEAIGRSVEMMISELTKLIKDTQMIERIESSMRTLLTPSVLLQGSTKNVQLYLALSGVEMDVGDSVTTQQELASALGTVESEITIAAREINTDTREAVFDWKSVPSPEAVKAFTERLMRQMAPESAGDIGAAMEKETVDIVDQTEFVVDLDTGWMKSVDHRRVMKVGDRERLDTTRITLIRVENP